MDNRADELGWVRKMKNEINQEEARIKLNCTYSAQFELIGRYKEETVGASVKIYDNRLLINCYSKARILPMDMIAMALSNQEILKMAKLLNNKSKEYRILVKRTEGKRASAEDTIAHQYKSNTIDNPNSTTEYKMKATKLNVVEGDFLELYHIFEEFNQNSFEIQWQSSDINEVSNINNGKWKNGKQKED